MKKRQNIKSKMDNSEKHINRYIVKLKHDTGTTSIIVVATNEESAKEKVLVAEGAPENAIISIRELKNKSKIYKQGTGSMARGGEIGTINIDEVLLHFLVAGLWASNDE